MKKKFNDLLFAIVKVLGKGRVVKEITKRIEKIILFTSETLPKVVFIQYLA